MKCPACGYEAQVKQFRYLYNPKIDDSLSLRQCPKCMEWIGTDELKGEAVRIVKPGDHVWDKSAGLNE
ncbi:hypothetical protein JCM12298_09640 [Desulfothermus naphthae]